MKKVNSRITISRVTDSRRKGGDDEYINITLHDRSSNEMIADVEMELVDFAQAITGTARQDAVALVKDNFDLLGKKREYMTATVPFDNMTYVTTGFDFKETIAEVIKPFEKDGWRHVQDEYNFRRYHREKGRYAVDLVRYVEVGLDATVS